MRLWPRAAVAGAVTWLVVVAVAVTGRVHRLGLVDVLLLAAPLILVPIGLPLLGMAGVVTTPVMALATRLQPVGAAAAAAAFLLPAGTLAGALALAWLAVAGLTALAGLAWLLERRSLDAVVLLPAAAVAYLAVGAMWLVLSRAGLTPLQLPAEIVELTGVHFHVAGFVVLTIASRVVHATRARPLPRRVATAAGLAAVVGSPVIAVGFVVLPVMLVVGAAILVCAVVALASTTLVAVVPHCSGSARVLLAVSSAAVLLPMVLALSYAAGRVFAVPALGIQAMAAIHGTLNAGGFGFLGLLGWQAEARAGGGGDAARALPAQLTSNP